MKTPQEAAREYAETLWNRESTPEWEVSRDACKTRSERDFLAGDAFGYRRGMEKAYRWISVMDGLPEDQDIIDANVRLIAAAPELLEALQKTNELLKYLDNTHTGDSRYAEFIIQYSENRKLIEKALEG